MWQSIRRARSAACRKRGRRSSRPAPPRCERTSATQAHLEAIDGAGVASTGPAGVIASSWRCSARAEHRAAAGCTGLLHSLAEGGRRPYGQTRDPRASQVWGGNTEQRASGIPFWLEHSRDVLKPISLAGSRNGCRLAPKTLACSSRRRQTACHLPTVARPSAHSARRVRGVQQPQLPREAPDVVDQRPRA